MNKNIMFVPPFHSKECGCYWYIGKEMVVCDYHKKNTVIIKDVK